MLVETYEYVGFKSSQYFAGKVVFVGMVEIDYTIKLLATVFGVSRNQHTVYFETSQI